MVMSDPAARLGSSVVVGAATKKGMLHTTADAVNGGWGLHNVMTCVPLSVCCV